MKIMTHCQLFLFGCGTCGMCVGQAGRCSHDCYAGCFVSVYMGATSFEIQFSCAYTLTMV